MLSIRRFFVFTITKTLCALFVPASDGSSTVNTSHYMEDTSSTESSAQSSGIVTLPRKT